MKWHFNKHSYSKSSTYAQNSHFAMFFIHVNFTHILYVFLFFFSKKISHFFYNYISTCNHYSILNPHQSCSSVSSVTACIPLGPICSVLNHEYSWAIHHQSVPLQAPEVRPYSDGRWIILRYIPVWYLRMSRCQDIALLELYVFPVEWKKMSRRCNSSYH